MSRTKKFIYGSMIAASLLLPVVALAQLQNPEVPVGGKAVTLSETQDIIKQIVQYLIIVGVIVAVGFIIWGGITYMAAGANEDASKAAKDRIKNGIIGAAVVLAVGVILQTVAGLISRSFFK